MATPTLARKSFTEPPSLYRMPIKMWAPQDFEGDQFRFLVGSAPIVRSCVTTIINYVRFVDWYIESDDENAKLYFTKLLETADEGKGWRTYVARLIDDALTMPFGGAAEIGALADGTVVWTGHIDAGTMRPTGLADYPYAQVDPWGMRQPQIYTEDQIGRVLWMPETRLRVYEWQRSPAADAVPAITALVRADRFWQSLLLDTPPAGVLDLMDMTESEARDWYESWKKLLAGQDAFKVPVLYGGQERKQPASFIPFNSTPVEIEMMGIVKLYAQEVTACFGLSLGDLGLFDQEMRLAGAAKLVDLTKRQGPANILGGIKSMIDNDILPDGVEFKWRSIDTDDVLRKAQATMQSATALSAMQGKVPDRLIEISAIALGIIPQEAVDEYAAELAGQADAVEQAPVDSVPTGADQQRAAGAGVIVALVPSRDVAEALAVEGGEAPDELHITLAFLGDASLIDQAKLLRAVDAFAAITPPLEGVYSGVGRFTIPDGDAIYASADIPGLPGWRQRLIEFLDAAGLNVDRRHGFTPHTTLVYVPTGEPVELEPQEPIEARFDEVWVWYAGQRTAFPLNAEALEVRADDINAFPERSPWAKKMRKVAERLLAPSKRGFTKARISELIGVGLDAYGTERATVDGIEPRSRASAEKALLKKLSSTDWWKAPNLVDEVFGILTGAYEEGITRAIKDAGGKVAARTVNLTNKDVLAALESHAGEFITQIDDGTRDMIVKHVMAGVEQGLSSPTIRTNILATQVQGTLLERWKGRTDSIVGFEIGRAESRAAKEEYTQIGLSKKAWRAVPGLACEICLSNMDAGEVEMDYMFESVFGEVDAPLGHPHCHCYLTFSKSELKALGTDPDWWLGG